METREPQNKIALAPKLEKQVKSKTKSDFIERKIMFGGLVRLVVFVGVELRSDLNVESVFLVWRRGYLIILEEV